MARCPECREPVSQFAAGCAVCGADLEAARRRRATRRRPSLPALPAVPQSVLLLAVVAFLVLAQPLLGAIVALLVLRAQTLSSQGPLRLALWLEVAVACALLLGPATRYGVLFLLL